jgi:hypothetical protein
MARPAARRLACVQARRVGAGVGHADSTLRQGLFLARPAGAAAGRT